MKRIFFTDIGEDRFLLEYEHDKDEPTLDRALLIHETTAEDITTKVKQDANLSDVIGTAIYVDWWEIHEARQDASYDQRLHEMIESDRWGKK